MHVDSISSLAAALKVPLNDLVTREIGVNDAVFGSQGAKGNSVVLRQIESGKILVDALHSSFSGEIVCNVEPTERNISDLSAFIENIERLINDPWDPLDSRGLNSLAERLRVSVSISSGIKKLKAQSIHVFLGTYSAYRLVPKFNDFDSQMYISGAQDAELVTLFKIVLDNVTQSKISLRVDDLKESSSLPPKKPLQSGGNDEIPF